MLASDFDFDLPESLIAQYPLPERTASRLLILSQQHDQLAESTFGHIGDYLRAGDLLVFNNTRVLKARLFGEKSTGGKVEIMLDRQINPYQAWAFIRASKSPKPGSVIQLAPETNIQVIERQAEQFLIQTVKPLAEILEEYGHIPLPPYIKRADELADLKRYQTVYGKEAGAVAAPTAGLHFDSNLLTALKNQAINMAYVTLHVGAGTFLPLRAAKVEDNVLHTETLTVTPEVVQIINQTKAQGGRVIAVGTTTVRALESAAKSGILQAYQGETSIFIYPGYQFKVIDGLITNFHLPRSSLLMLVCALAGQAKVLAAYQHAVAAGFRFFSYGDAMLVY